MKKKLQEQNNTAQLLNSKIKLFILIILVSSSIVYFASSVFSVSTIEYLSVKDAVNIDNTSENQIGVSGKLVKNSYFRDANGIRAHFNIKDEEGILELPVVYDGEIGKIFFNEYAEIILQGEKSQGTFVAKTLTIRCPSKYITEAEKAELDLEKNKTPKSPPYESYKNEKGT
ncbi:MAG: hypothetical protein CL748_01605 [Chloroflexi bacterium]|nr:hypothetical protein [Chloroflexota bacterium]